jgi:hypothetical protein
MQFEFALAQKQVYQKDGGLGPTPTPDFFIHCAGRRNIV